jgi:DNA-binding GntR family transcriptional regulator
MAERAVESNGLEALVESLRRDLASGQYHPRERLVEADLVERYSTTRATVREALLVLAAEGLVERLPNRGARVTEMTPAEAIEIAEIRRLLETLCAGRAAHATSAERAEFATVAAEAEAAAVAAEVNAYLVANDRFHAKITELAHHATAERILTGIRNRAIDRQLPRAFRASPPAASVAEHAKIAAAIAAGDSAAASAAMHEHLTSLIEVLQAYSLASLGASA